MVTNLQKNGYVPEKKIQREKIFKIDIFVSKHVLDHSKSISTENFFLKNFRFFCHQFFEKNGYVPEKKFQREEIFEIDIFVLKHVLNNSKSIPTKKFFLKNFRFFGHQFFEETAMSLKKILTGKNFQNRYFRSKTRFGPF